MGRPKGCPFFDGTLWLNFVFLYWYIERKIHAGLQFFDGNLFV